MVVGPVGPAFAVNTTPANTGWPSAVAMNGSGQFVAGWQADGDKAIARRFEASGAPATPELHVTDATVAHSTVSGVAIDAAGDFVVTWFEPGDGTYGPGDLKLYAQRYGPSGDKQGTPIRVDSTAVFSGAQASVAMDHDGDFVVTWDAWAAPGVLDGVHAQRFDRTGARQGPEFSVSDNAGAFGRVAMDADGDFVVAWARYGQEGGEGFDVYARRFDPTGAPRGGEFRVNEAITGTQMVGQVATDPAGDFLITWDSSPGSNQFWSPYGRRYDADGAARGAAFPLTPPASDNTRVTGAAMNAGGGFVVSWQTFAAGATSAPVRVQPYGADGQPRAAPTTVVADTNYGMHSTAALADSGDFLLLWNGRTNVNAQRFGERPAPRVTGVFVSGSAWTPAFKQFLQRLGLGDATYGFALRPDALEQLPWVNLDRVSVRFSDPVVVAPAHLSVQAPGRPDETASDVAYDAGTRTATWTLSQPLRAGRLTFRVDAGAGGVASPAGLALDGEWPTVVQGMLSGDGTPGGDFRFRVDALPGDVDRSGQVLAEDFSQTKSKFFSAAGPGSVGRYDVYHDVDGSGDILAYDFSEVKKRFFNTLPPAQPVAAAAVTVRVRESVTRDVLGTVIA